MNGTDIELRKELWMWRGVTILVMLILLVAHVTTFYLDRDKQARDDAARIRNWTLILANQDRIRSMLLMNRQLVGDINQKLEQCGSCHHIVSQEYYDKIQKKLKEGGKK